ncbi:hypothetical protein HK097_010049, partial [Rhizophlyctis rosea]
KGGVKAEEGGEEFETPRKKGRKGKKANVEEEVEARPVEEKKGKKKKVKQEA